MPGQGARRVRDRKTTVISPGRSARSRHTYGSPGITEELRSQGRSVGGNRVARLMRAHGIRAKTATTDSRHKLPVADNTLDRQSTVKQPDRVWAGDITCSRSRKGNCRDNACVESFFGTLEKELVHHRHSRTREEARQDMFEWIEVFYNLHRRHSTLGYRSPAEFEAIMKVA